MYCKVKSYQVEEHGNISKVLNPSKKIPVKTAILSSTFLCIYKLFCAVRPLPELFFKYMTLYKMFIVIYM